MKRCCTRRENEKGLPSDGKEIEPRGTCEGCSDQPENLVRVPLTEYLDTIAVPVILFDSDRNVVAANRWACEYLGKSPDRVEGSKAGDVFECEHARLPEGCGNTVHCSGCTLRRAILDTLIFEKECQRVPVHMGGRGGSEARKPDFLISTEKKFSVVLLKIDPVDAGSDTPDKEQG